MFSIRKKANSQNYYLCGTECGISKVKNDHIITVGPLEFPLFAGESVHKSCRTSNSHVAEQIAEQATRIVREENPELYNAKTARSNRKNVTWSYNPAVYKPGDPDNIDNWTMGDAFQYRIDDKATSPQVVQILKRLQKRKILTPFPELPDCFGDWPLLDRKLLKVYEEYRWKNVKGLLGRTQVTTATKNTELSHIGPCLTIAEQISQEQGSNSYSRPTIKMPKPTKQRSTFLSKEEVEKLYAVLNKKPRSRVKLFLYPTICVNYLGARPVEIARIQWSDVVLDHATPQNSRVRLWNKKNSEGAIRERWVHMNDVVYKIFCDIKKSPRDDYVFRHSYDKPWAVVTNTNGVGRVPGFTVHITKAIKEAGLRKDVVPYSLRHTFATWLLSQGENIATVADLMGHTNLETTRNYLHILDPVKINAVNNLGIADGTGVKHDKS